MQLILDLCREGTMPKISSTISIVILSALLLTACNFGGLPLSQTQNQSPLGTAAAQTIVAMSVQLTMAASGGTEQPSQTTAAVENTSQPSATPMPTETALTPTASLTPVGSIPTVLVTQISQVPCNRFDFVSDITVGDYTNFYPGSTFTKTWRVRNSGTCSWNSTYSLVFDSGSSLGGPASVALPGVVAPGQMVDLSVTLQAPSYSGTYRGYWKLQSPDGVRFGYGYYANTAMWVLITVGATPVYANTSTPQVTGSCSQISVSPAIYHQYTRGADFDSKWVIENTSGSTWESSEVDFEYISGKKMYKYNSIYDLPADVKNDHQVTLIVDSIAPNDPGTYTTTWGLVKGSTRLCTMSVTIEVK